MTPEFPPNNPRAELEARLTAFILGELPAHDAAALRQTIDDDPELAALYDRLNAAHKLVREVAASPAEPAKESIAPLRLSEARRQKLLAQFKTVAPKEFAPAKRPDRKVWHLALEIAAVLAIIGLLASLGIPNFVGTRMTSQRNSVINNLRQIDGAKQQWALSTHAPPDAEPKVSDLQPYLGRGNNGEFPQAIAGENYKIGKMDELPVAEFGSDTAIGKRQRRISLDDGAEATAKLVSPMLTPAGTPPTFGARSSNHIYSYAMAPAPAGVPEENQAHDFERFYERKTPQAGGDNAQAVSPTPPPAKTTIVLPPMENSGNGDVALTWKTQDGSTRLPDQNAKPITTSTPSGYVDTSMDRNNGNAESRSVSTDGKKDGFNFNSVVTNSFSAGVESLGLSTNNSTAQVGDPAWIGYLEHAEPHRSSYNPFAGRGSFVAIPQGNSIDVNSIHNQTSRLATLQNDGSLDDSFQPAQRRPIVVAGKPNPEFRFYLDQNGNGTYDTNTIITAQSAESTPVDNVILGSDDANRYTKYRQLTQFSNSASAERAADSADFAQPNYAVTNEGVELLTSPEITTESGRMAKLESSSIEKIVSPRAAESRESSVSLGASLAPDDGQNYTIRVVDGKLVPVPAPNNDLHFATSPYVTGTYFGGINAQAPPPQPVAKAESPRAGAGGRSSGRVVIGSSFGSVNGQAAGFYPDVGPNGTITIIDGNPVPTYASTNGMIGRAPTTDDSFALVEQAQQKKDYQKADAELSSIVAAHPRNARALDALRENRKLLDLQAGHLPSQELTESIPAWRANEVQTATLVQDGKMLYEVGKLDEAKAKFKDALKADPGNVAATQYLKLGEEKQMADATRRGELHSGQALLEVEKAWNSEPRSGKPEPRSNPFSFGNPQSQPVAKPAESSREIAGNQGNVGGSSEPVSVRSLNTLGTSPVQPGGNATGSLSADKKQETDTNVYTVNVVGYVNLEATNGFNLVANPLDLEGDGKRGAGSSPASVSTNDAFLSVGPRTSGFNDRLKALGLKSAGIGSSGKVASDSFAIATQQAAGNQPVVAALPKTPTDKVPLLGDLPVFGRLYRSNGNTNTTAESILNAGEIDSVDVPIGQFTSGSQYPNQTKLGDVTVTIDPENKRVFFITDAESNAVAEIMRHLDTNPAAAGAQLPLIVSTNYAADNGQQIIPIHYAKASDISEALKSLGANKEADGHGTAYREKKAELDRLKKFQEILALRTAQHSVEITMPPAPMTQIIEHADGKPSQNQGLGQRIGRMFTGRETQTARIKIEHDVTDVPGVSGQPGMTGVYDPYFVQTEFEVIQSEKILDQVIDKLKLDQVWAAQKGSIAPLTKSETRALLKKNLEVAPEKNTSLLDIKVKSDKPEEAARIANTIAEVYQDYRKRQREDLIEGGMKAAKIELADQQKKIAQVEQELDELRKSEKVVDADVPAVKHSTNAPIPQPEVSTAENAFSTFSLNISDVSLKLAAASLEKGRMPDASSIRSEEFINAFDYRDPEPAPGAPLGFAWERAQYPFAHNRDLLRFAVKTAATGREPGRPLNIVLLLDKSGSMERADRVRIIHEALRVLAAQLQPQDKISVVTFARVARLWVDGLSGNQAAQVADGLDQLTPEGGTNLEEAMRLAYETARRHYLANGVNRVVLLTDGAANLGNVDPDALKVKAEEHRKEGIALDCFGVGWEGYNDDLLEVLSRNGGGRYGFINTPEEAATDFVGQLAGALNAAAYDVKVQVEFNPKRVTNWRQIGYAKHQLTKEQFRDNTVKAAQIAAAESGNGLYAIEVNPNGEGPVATVRVRYRVPGTEDYPEHEYEVPYTGGVLPLEQSSPAMRLMGSASAFSEWLASSPFAGEVTTDKLLGLMSSVPETYGADQRPKKLEWMIRQAKSLEGK